ncbi:MAG: hypothetical protein M1269_08970 [Chloroflexi bacterium]|nr:hypothetical protein [Chloroflexota bacterium]
MNIKRKTSLVVKLVLILLLILEAGTSVFAVEDTQTTPTKPVEIFKAPGYLVQYCWHPSGKYITVMHSKDSLIEHPMDVTLIDPLTGKTEKLITESTTGRINNRWSPDGKWFRFWENSAPNILDFYSRKKKVLYKQGSGTESLNWADAIWSPDSNAIACINNETRKIDIFNLEGKKLRQIPMEEPKNKNESDVKYNLVAWSPGNVIHYSRGDLIKKKGELLGEWYDSLYEFNCDTGVTKQVFAPQKDFSVGRYSYKGHFYVIEHEFDGYYLPKNQIGLTKKTPNSYKSRWFQFLSDKVFSFDISPDGKYLVFSSTGLFCLPERYFSEIQEKLTRHFILIVKTSFERGQEYKFNSPIWWFSTYDAKIMTDFGENPQWSPDGKYIVFSNSSNIGYSDNKGYQLWLLKVTKGDLP